SWRDQGHPVPCRRTHAGAGDAGGQPVVAHAAVALFIDAIQVPGGFDMADTAIVERVRAGDLVVTQDIPLAARVVERGAAALNPRGERYSADNMAERLSVRDFMEELRGAGVQTGGPSSLHARDRQAFANQLDRWLAARG